jgi:hypothetical protein
LSDTTQAAPAIGTPADVEDPLVVTLSEPAQLIDTTVTKVRLTPPRGVHLMKAGAAMRIITKDDSDEVGIEINPAAMGKLIGVCFNLPIRTVEQLPAKDFMALSTKLLPFLGGTTS